MKEQLKENKDLVLALQVGSAALTGIAACMATVDLLKILYALPLFILVSAAGCFIHKYPALLVPFIAVGLTVAIGLLMQFGFWGLEMTRITYIAQGFVIGVVFYLTVIRGVFWYIEGMFEE